MGWLNFNKPLTSKTTTYANIPKISSDNVKNIIEASYKTNRAIEGDHKTNGYTLDHSLSNREHKVFKDRQGNPYVAFTGTRKASDWLTDGALAVGLGGFTHRFQDSKHLIDEVKSKYKNKPVTTIGHSLGGTLAEHAGGDKVITLDKGVGLFGIGKHIGSNQTDIRTQTDPVSLLSRFQTGDHKIDIKNTTYLDPFKAHDFRHISKLHSIL